MDRFVKNALLLCLLISILLLCLSLIGTELLGQQFVGTDEKVQNSARSSDSALVLPVPFNYHLEPAFYSVLSAAGGFVCGYLYVDVFYNRVNAHG